jgi:hypothetical protein
MGMLRSAFCAMRGHEFQSGREESLYYTPYRDPITGWETEAFSCERCGATWVITREIDDLTKVRQSKVFWPMPTWWP